MKYVIVVFFLALSFFGLSIAAEAQIAEGVTVAIAAEEIETRIDNITQTATNSGDYLIGSAALEARALLENFKLASSNLLDETFAKVSRERQQALLDIDAIVTRLEAGVSDVDSDVKRLEATMTNLIQDVKFGRRVIVLGYSPYTIAKLPGTGGNTTLSVRGTNLDKSQMVLNGFGSAPIFPSSVTRSEIRFLVPNKLIGEAEKVLYTHNATLSFRRFRTGFAAAFRDWLAPEDNESVPITLLSMPSKIGEYELLAKHEVTQTETRRRTIDAGRFHGRNERIYKTIQPEAGWRFDYAEPPRFFEPRDNSYIRCDGTERAEAFGIRVYARADQHPITLKYPTGSSVGTDCSLTITEIREVAVTKEWTQTGDIERSSDTSITLPPLTSGVRLTLNLFAEEDRVSLGSDEFKTVRIRRDGDTLVIRPKVIAGVVN